MVRTKWVLDACSGVGGATRGYQQAGFKVLGVDTNDQPNYCGDDFIQGDAVEYIKNNGHLFDFIHASWPCQRYCTLTAGTNRGNGREYPDLIPAGREAMESSGKPWVIENVINAPVRRDVLLCGEMFKLDVIRHRKFECWGVTVPQPDHILHRGRVRGYSHGKYYDGPYIAAYGSGGDKGSMAELRSAMGMAWPQVRKEITEAIPPAYTRYIGSVVYGQI